MAINRKYKDTVFRHLFNNPERLLELFNALMGTNYRDAGSMKINTLKNVFYRGMKNDISFEFDDALVLIEHQSTLSKDMALRIALYLFRLLEKISKTKPEALDKKYSKEIPNPVLIILYNGKEDFPAEKTLYLSDIFKKKYGRKIIVDAEIKILNINKGFNPELMSRCKTLSDYAEFIAKVREYEKDHTLDEAMDLAIEYCISNDILKEYLTQNSTEGAPVRRVKYSMVRVHVRKSRSGQPVSSLGAEAARLGLSVGMRV